jgi:hypothetical protein
MARLIDKQRRRREAVWYHQEVMAIAECSNEFDGEYDRYDVLKYASQNLGFFVSSQVRLCCVDI